MKSTLTKQQTYEMNYEIPYEDQKAAATAIRKTGAAVKEMPIIVWFINGEYISPATMIRRLEEGFYVSKEKEVAAEIPPKYGQEGLDVSRDKGKSTRPVAKKSGRVLRDTNKRGSGQQGRRDNGRGAGKAVLGRDSNLKAVARAEAKIVRKYGSGVSDEEDYNGSYKEVVERRRVSSANTSKSRGAGKSDLARPKTLRGKNKTRISPKAGLRKRRS